MKVVPHWLKIDTNIFNNKKIKRIRKMPEGDSIFTLWVYMICEGMKNVSNPGVLEIAKGIPMTDDDFSDATDIKLDTIRMAIDAFSRHGMIVPDENGCIEIPSFREHQSIDRIEDKREQTRIRVQKHRLIKKQQLIEQQDDVTRYGNVCNDRVEKNRIDKSRVDKSKVNKEASKEENTRLFEEFWNKYNYKVSKAISIKAFNKLSEKEKDLCLAGIDRYQATVRDRKFLKHPSTYINQKVWEDEAYTETREVYADEYTRRTQEPFK
jgi:predicted phage replisome organizer